jgi:hypothetical protein
MGGLCSIAIDFKIFKMLLSFPIFKKKQRSGGAFSYHLENVPAKIRKNYTAVKW